MPEQIQDETAALLAPMLKKTLFVAANRAVASAEAIRPFIANHLRYMDGLEARGALFASGPSARPDLAGPGRSSEGPSDRAVDRAMSVLSG